MGYEDKSFSWQSSFYLLSYNNPPFRFEIKSSGHGGARNKSFVFTGIDIGYSENFSLERDQSTNRQSKPSNNPPAPTCDITASKNFSTCKSPRFVFVEPLMPFECLPRQADLILHRLGRKASDEPALRTYFSKNAVCDLPTLFSHLKLLNYALNQKTEPDIVGMPFSWNIPYPVLEELPIELKIEVAPEDPWNENTLMSYLRYGRLDATDEECIAASRTSVQAGMDFSLANALASYYLDKILHAKTKSELTYLFYDYFQEYTKRIARIHQFHSHSVIVRQIHQYIQSHLYESITPALLAENLHMNGSYLCTHFRKETGKTISIYVQECKIEEARRLLEYKELSLVTIAEMLGFSSQSYFCSVFKRVIGKTPKEYRENPDI